MTNKKSQNAWEKNNPEKNYHEPPNSLPTERALLGVLLMNNAAAEVIRGTIEVEHFYEPVHGRIFDTIMTLTAKGSIANPIKLEPYFKDDPALEDVGGTSYLVRMAGSAPTLFNPQDYAGFIVSLAKRRAIIEACDVLREDAMTMDADVDVDKILDNAEQVLFRAREGTTQTQHWVEMGDAAPSAMREAVRASQGPDAGGLSTGLEALDKKIGGLQGGRLIIIGGRPGMGKSILAGHLVRVVSRPSNATRGRGVGVFSLEMPKTEYTQRLISDLAYRQGHTISYYHMATGQLTKEKIKILSDAAYSLSKLPISIDDGQQTISTIYIKSRRLMRHFARDNTDLSLIVVDYLQLISGQRRPRQTREEEIRNISKGLKDLAKELNVPVVAVCQLNREVERREDKRPQLSDIRESGAIEQDADIVLFPFRGEYYKCRDEPDPVIESDKWATWKIELDKWKDRLEIIVAKQRGGPIGKIMVFCSVETATLQDEICQE